MDRFEWRVHRDGKMISGQHIRLFFLRIRFCAMILGCCWATVFSALGKILFGKHITLLTFFCQNYIWLGDIWPHPYKLTVTSKKNSSCDKVPNVGGWDAVLPNFYKSMFLRHIWPLYYYDIRLKVHFSCLRSQVPNLWNCMGWVVAQVWYLAK